MGASQGNESATDTNSTDIMKEVAEIQGKISEFNKTIDDCDYANKNIIFIGNTGAGKSTLINYLAGNKLVAFRKRYESKDQNSDPNEDDKSDFDQEDSDEDSKEDADEDDEYLIDAVNPICDIIIGNSSSSETKKPAYWVSEDKIAYWDCPGFGDTTGEVQDITNAFYINKLLENSKQTCVVLVIEKDTIKASRNNRLSTLVNEIKKLGLINSLNSVSLVVTSWGSKTNFIEHCKNDVLKSASKDKNKDLEIFIKHFIKHKKQVALFPKPKKVGTIDTKKADSIKKVIERASPLPNGKIKPSISEKAETLIHNCEKILNKEISRVIEDNASKSIGAIHTIVKNENAYSTLKDKLKAIKDTCDDMKNEDEKSRRIEAFTLFQEVLNIKNHTEINVLQTNISLLNFFSDIYSHIALDQGIFKQLNKSEKLCKMFLSSSNKSKILDGVLTIERPFLKMSKVRKEFLIKNEYSFHSINIYSYSFYFDSDAEFPGKNLCIQTQYVHVQKDLRIDLQGEEGEKINTDKANDGQEDGDSGQDGIPGRPGKPGGSFFLSFKQSTATGILEIDVRGGKGSKGQNGGNGKRGKDGAKSSIEKLLKRDEKYCVKRIPIKFSDKDAKGKTMHAIKTFGTFNGQMLEIYRCEGLPGQKGGDAGKGGIGGKGGYSGIIEISCPDLIIQEITGKGKDGFNGNHGDPGQGGEQGNTCYGQYVSEYMFPSFRVKEKNLDTNSLIHAASTTSTNLASGTASSIIGETATFKGVQALVTGGVQTTTNFIKQSGVNATSKAIKGLNAAKFGAGMAIGLTFQTGLSIASAYTSSDWITYPKEDDEEEFKREVAEKGLEPSDHNTNGMENPTESIKHEPNETEFQEFISRFSEKVNVFMEDNEVLKWFE